MTVEDMKTMLEVSNNTIYTNVIKSVHGRQSHYYIASSDGFYLDVTSFVIGLVGKASQVNTIKRLSYMVHGIDNVLKHKRM